MRVKVRLDPASAILAKRKLGKGGQAQRYMVSEVRRKTDPYVPFLNGPLKNTAVEHENSIEYVTPYARRQYYEHKGDGLRGRECGQTEARRLPRVWLIILEEKQNDGNGSGAGDCKEMPVS